MGVKPRVWQGARVATGNILGVRTEGRPRDSPAPEFQTIGTALLPPSSTGSCSPSRGRYFCCCSSLPYA